MTHYRVLRKAALAGVLALPILTAGCGLFSEQASQQIDPPQNSEQTSSTGATNAAGAVTPTAQNGTTATPSADAGGEAVAEGQTQMTVYLRDQNQLLAPVTVLATLGAEETAGQRALELMVQGGANESELPAGFEAVLPAGTAVNKLDVIADQKKAVVDFNKAFGNYAATDERRIVEAVTWTLTSLPGIDKVELSMDGVKLGEMPVDGYPLDEALTRAVGINLETAEGVDYSQSTPVTLYFSSVTPNDEPYYVPVTRLINRTDNKAKAAIEQLIAGPSNLKSLTPVATPDIQVKDVKKEKDYVTIDLKDEAYQDGQAMPAQMLKAVVLALAENTGYAKVKITVNGSASVIDTENNSYSEPVDKPVYVNTIKS
ncbi:GerMN domain-containing protein [Paenibacillus aurantiacus]|uniref:GerMN domain-containing protein n=1 Tax=Paenibacillus aurantiacus TaxID=1936118 RepID=A0ABV5KQ07_9BACL